MQIRSQGFTIVELLIVIVVIGILAAITITAFNGVQARANNTQTTAAVRDYIKALTLYAQDNGAYPTSGGCLGDAYASGKCLSQNGLSECFGLGTASTNPTFNNLLKPYLNNKLPMPSEQQVSCGATTYSGAWEYYNTTAKAPVIHMVLRGDQVCPKFSPVAGSGKAYSGDVSLCNYTLPTL